MTDNNKRTFESGSNNNINETNLNNQVNEVKDTDLEVNDKEVPLTTEADVDRVNTVEEPEVHPEFNEEVKVADDEELLTADRGDDDLGLLDQDDADHVGPAVATGRPPVESMEENQVDTDSADRDRLERERTAEEVNRNTTTNTDTHRTATTNNNVEKPFYTSWWFWLLVILILLAIWYFGFR